MNNEKLLKEVSKIPQIETQLDNITNKNYKTFFNVKEYKTNLNTWNEALKITMLEAKKVVESNQDIGGIWLGCNVTVKMPRGRYTITETIPFTQYIDLDLEGVTFLAEPNNKTINCFDGIFYRCMINKGAFVGFKTALRLNTNNIDTSFLHLVNPTFQSCEVGLDTVSYLSSRSTNVQIDNIYSLKTDQPLKVHCDMCKINGGWIYHSGNGEKATIYNQSFMSIEDVVFVPTPNASRWIDNYSKDSEIGISNDRSLSIKHCRFGGEVGAPTLIYNYSKFGTNYSSKPASSINIEDCIIQCPGKPVIKLFAIPNIIKINGCTGFTDLTQGLISLDSSADTIGATREFITIDIDNYSSVYKLFDNDLLNIFVKNKRNFNEKTFEAIDFTKKIQVKSAIDTKYIEIPLKLIPYKSGSESSHATSVKTSFLLTVHGSGSNPTYSTTSFYHVALVGRYQASPLVGSVTQVICTPISILEGGDYQQGAGFKTEFKKAEWNETVNSYVKSAEITGIDILKLHFTSNLASVEILPLSGVSYGNKYY